MDDGGAALTAPSPRRWWALLGAALLWAGPASALPRPLLGPDGPLYLGPLPPTAEDPRGVAVVEPDRGRLVLVLEGAAGSFAWEDGAWTRDGSPLVGPDEVVEGEPADLAGREIVPEGDRWEWSDRGLVGVVDRQGGRIAITPDEQGRPARLSWADGSNLVVSRDSFGRVVRTQGPGEASLSLAWRDGGVVLTDPLGAPLRVRPGPGQREARRSVEVEDGLGRIARAFYSIDAEGVERLVGWEDPRGLQAWISRAEGRVEVVDGAGRGWRVELDRWDQVSAVVEPAGWRWTWRRDGVGRVVGVEDPAGRIHSWERDREGRLAAVGRGALPWRLQWDQQGRLAEIRDPVGGSTRLERDSRGRVVRVTDPLGNEVRLERSAAGEVQSVAGRSGSRWRVERDLLGRPARVTGADDRRLELVRDLAGRLVGLRDPIRGSFTLDRTLAGALIRLAGPSGEAVDLRRDGQGRLVGLGWGEGGSLELRRDAAGEVIELRLGDRVVGVQRDAVEAPLAAGPVRWRRDGAGRVIRLDAPGRSVALRYDGAGLLAGVGDEAEGWWLRLTRDGAGRVVRWQGTDGEVRVRRSPLGRITEEVVLLAAGRPDGALGEAAGQDPAASADTGDADAPADPLAHHLGTWADDVLPEDPDPARPEVGPAPAEGAPPGPEQPLELRQSWDARGRLARVDLPGRGWRVLRDAAGRLLRLTGPDGQGLGVDRDAAGRPVVIRHPGHTLLRADYGGADLVSAVDDAGGRRLGARLVRFDAQDRVTADEVPEWGARTWERDPRGQVAVVRVGAEAAWTFGPAGATGPDGSEVVLDAAGRVQSARPPAGAAAWGAGSATVSYAWSEAGPLEWVAGELGAVRVVHDGLGRLVALEPEVGEPWTLRYDARGRLARIERGGRVLHRLAWGAAVDDGPASILASGPESGETWLPGPLGPAGLVGAGGLVDLVLGLDGEPWWLVPGAGAALPRSVDLRGYPELGLADGSGADLVGPAGSLQPFPGGPLVALAAAEGGAVPAGVALDPVSGQRVDGLQPWPWAAADWWQDGGPDLLDPAPWAPTGPWQEPLRLLVALGELESPLPEGWVPVPDRVPTVPWLPASLEGGEPPLGPPLLSLPLDEDPLTVAWVLACLPGTPPPSASLAAELLLAEELDLPWLPPGLDLPLPWSGRPISDRPLPVSRN